MFKRLTQKEFHDAFVLGIGSEKFGNGPVEVEFSGIPPKPKPMAGVWLPFDGHALILEETGPRPAFVPGHVERLKPPVGKWLMVDGFELVKGPDRRLWNQVLDVFDSHEEVNAEQDRDPESGLPVGPVHASDVFGKFPNDSRIWMLVLDEHGNIARGKFLPSK